MAGLGLGGVGFGSAERRFWKMSLRAPLMRKVAGAARRPTSVNRESSHVLLSGSLVLASVSESSGVCRSNAASGSARAPGGISTSGSIPGSDTTCPTCSSVTSRPPWSSSGAGSNIIASTASPGDVACSSHAEHRGMIPELTKPQRWHDHNRSTLLNTLAALRG